MAEDVLATAANSSGSALAENEKYLNSINGELAKFAAVFQELSQTAIQSEFIKDVIGLGSAILDILKGIFSVIEALGGLKTVLIATLGILSIVKADSILSTLSAAGKKIGSFGRAISNTFSTFIGGFKASKSAGDSSLKSIGAGFKSVSAAASTAQIAIASFVAIITVISLVKSAIENARQANIELQRETIEAKNAELDKIAVFKESAATYMKYADQINLTASEESALAASIEQVEKAMEDKESRLAGLTAGTKAYAEALREQVSEELKSQYIAAKEKRKAAEELLGDIAVDPVKSARFDTEINLDIYDGRINTDEFEKASSVLRDLMGDFIEFSIRGETLGPNGLNASLGWKPNEKDMDATVEYYYSLLELQRELAEQDLMNNHIYSRAVEITNLLTESVNGYIQAKYEEIAAEYEYKNGLPSTVEEFEKYRKHVNEALGEDFTFDELPSLIDGYMASNSGYAEFMKQLQEEEAAAKAISAKRKEIAEALVPKDYESLESGTAPYIHALNQWNKEVDEYKDKLAELSDEELDYVLDIVVNQGVTSWDDITAALDKFSTKLNPAAAKIKDSLQDLWNSENFKESKSSLLEMADALDGITPSDIEELAKESEELAAILKEDGMNAQFLANILQTVAKGGDGFELIAGFALDLNSALEGLAGRFDEATEAKVRYDKAMSVKEKDVDFRSYVEAYESLMAEFKAGTTNSNTFWASAEFLFGEDKLAASGWGDGLDKIQKMASQLAPVFSDAESAGFGLLERLYELSKAGKVLDESGNVLAQISKNADGSFDFDIDDTRLAELADTMNAAEPAILACLQALSMWGNVDYHDIAQVTKVIDDYGLAVDTASGKAINIDTVTDQLLSLGKTHKEVHQLVSELKDLDGVSLISADSSVEDLTDSLIHLGIAAKDGATIKVDYTSLSDMLSGIGLTKEAAIQLVEKLGDAEGISLDTSAALAYIQTLDFTQTAQSVNGIGASVDGLNQKKTDGATNEIDAITQSANNAATAVDNIGTSITNLNGKTATITLNADYTIRRNILGGIFGYAKGTKGAAGGVALLGEEGEELVQSGDRAYLIGSNGPELANLQRGDIVYTNAETQKIKRGASTIPHSFPAFSRGTGIGPYKPSSSSGGSNSSTQNASSEFERMYNYHQHLLAMDAESVAEYLAWLDKAYKAAYKAGKIDLEDYYKYEEEVYKGLQDLYKDYLNDVEHEISMRGNYEGETKAILKLYKDMLKSIEKEIAAAKARGLDNTDDYVQYLQNKFQDIKGSIQQLQEETTDNAKDAVQALIDFRIGMLKQDIKNEKEAIDKKLEYLRDFYDKQKQLLQDAYDEEKYLKEQSEKRKSIADIQSELAQLEFDDSAWAQKRKLELLEELRQAQEELDEFERDHALQMAQDELDRIYEMQENELDAEAEALDEKLNNAQALYEQALADIKNGSVELYEAMIEYNNLYGDGIADTIVALWEEAYAALERYFDLYNKHYNDINLENATGYEKPTESWDDEGVAQNPPGGGSGGHTDPGGSPGSNPYGKASETTGNIKQGAKGKSVKAIQYALNELGYGNSGTKKVDGNFGSNTAKAVKAFQKAMGVNTDGVVGKNTRAKFKAKGYASGTPNAQRGLFAIDELGEEYIFESSDGNRYRMFSGGEKVLNAKATNFLYNFANAGGEFLSKSVADALQAGGLYRINGGPKVVNEIHMGDVIVNGSTDKQTISQIRRANRDNLTQLLKQINHLSRY